MAVTGVTGTQSYTSTTSTTATQATSGNTLDYNSFLTLLIAQMKNQNPLEPMASSDYVAQLATFSQVEKSVQANEKLSALMVSQNLALAESLVGKTVVDTTTSVGGVVIAAKAVDNGVMVLLDNGQEFMVGEGLIIAETSTTPPETPET
jgi:flagellar basal-body rod modification protein FlgD